MAGSSIPRKNRISMDISILLPSRRKQLCLDRIAQFAQDLGGLDYEIVVCGDVPIEEERTTWIPDDKLTGTVYSTNLCYAHSTGKVVAWWSDNFGLDSRPCTRALYDFVMQDAAKPVIAASHPYMTIYGKPTAPVGCIHRNTLTTYLNNTVFNPVFKSFYADIDLSLRLLEAGGQCIGVPGVRSRKIIQGSDHVALSKLHAFQAQDTETFIDLWHQKLDPGAPRPTHPSQIGAHCEGVDC